MSRPIPEFGWRGPIKLWQHHGIDCAVYMGVSFPCGYVRLPEESPLRPVAAAADVVLRAEHHDDMFTRWLERIPDGRLGHEGLNDLLSAHGGLTFGPTPDGWIGFDTGHAFDIWDIDELRTLLPENSEERRVFEYMASIGELPGQIAGRYRVGYEFDWTLDKLVRAVEQLADQVAAIKVER